MVGSETVATYLRSSIRDTARILKATQLTGTCDYVYCLFCEIETGKPVSTRRWLLELM